MLLWSATLSIKKDHCEEKHMRFLDEVLACSVLEAVWFTAASLTSVSSRSKQGCPHSCERMPRASTNAWPQGLVLVATRMAPAEWAIKKIARRQRMLGAGDELKQKRAKKLRATMLPRRAP